MVCVSKLIFLLTDYRGFDLCNCEVKVHFQVCILDFSKIEEVYKKTKNKKIVTHILYTKNFKGNVAAKITIKLSLKLHDIRRIKKCNKCRKIQVIKCMLFLMVFKES